MFHDGIIQNDGVSVPQNFAADIGQGSGFGGAGGKRTSSQAGRFWGWLNWHQVGFGKNNLINLWQPIPQKGINSLNADQTDETGLSTKGIQNLAPKFWNTEQIAITLWSHRLKGFCNLSCFPGSGVVLLLRDLFWSPPSSPLRRRSRRSAPRRVSRACRLSGTSRWIARPTHGPGNN